MDQVELEDFALNLAEHLKNPEFRRQLFKILLLQTVEEDNRLIAREGLQNSSVNHLQSMKGNRAR